MGARATALGYASACLSDTWSIFNNIAGLTKVKSATAAFTYDVQPSFKPFNKAAAVIALPLKIGNAGIGVYRFGDSHYHEQILTTGFSSAFGLASLGIKINYIQYNADGFGRRGMVSISLGGIAQITPQFSVGAHITNLNQPIVSAYDGERVPTILTAGILFKPADHVLVLTEIEKDLSYQATWKTGIEYSVHEKIAFRLGFNLKPNAAFLGLAFKARKFVFDYAYKYSFALGARHQATVAYPFKKKGT